MATAYPLAWPEGWPRTPAGQRRPSRFDTPYTRALDNLHSELRLLGAVGIVVSSNAPLRRDGRPYQDAMTDELPDPGVAVYFHLPAGPRVMARDLHPTPAENLHAIGHVIAHLRGLARHGGSFMMERAFAGFAAIPPPRPWHDILGVPPAASLDEIDAAFRRLARQAHPDAGGSDARMAELNAAREAARRARA